MRGILGIFLRFWKVEKKMTCFSSSFGYTSFVPERSNKKGARFAKARETVAFCIAAKSLAKKALPYPLWFAVHQVLRTDASNYISQ